MAGICVPDIRKRCSMESIYRCHHRARIIQMSQEMPNFQHFLALVFSCDNQMTIIFDKYKKF